MNAVQEAKSLGLLTTVELQDLAGLGLPMRMPNQSFCGQHGAFCGHPNEADQEIAETELDKLAHFLDCDEVHASCIRECHRRFWGREEATGRGSWPAKCHPDRFPENHSAGYYIDRDEFPSHFWKAVSQRDLDDLAKLGVWGSRDEVMDRYAGKPMMDVALLLAERSSARVGCALFEETDHSKANIHIVGRVIPGGVIGIGWFNNGTCGDHVECHLDTSYQVGLHPWVELLDHEFGHNRNLEHQFRNENVHNSIMSYSRRHPYVGFSTGEPPYDRPRDPSWVPLTRFFGGEGVPIDDEIPDVPEIPELGGQVTARQLDDGTFAWDGVLAIDEHKIILEKVPGENTYRPALHVKF